MKASPPISSRAMRGGFTLIELLVSSAIICLVMMILLSATSASLGMWRGAEKRIAVDREGRTGMALMADDLANMLARTSAPPQPVLNQGDVFMAFPVLRPADYQDTDNVANVGDVCYVHYRYDSNDKKIYRSHEDSKATFDAMKSGAAPAASAYEILADNVTDLTVNAYDTNGASTTLPANINSISLSIGVVDKQERENLTNNPPIIMPDSKTSKQYFSINAAVPRPQ